jgi:hypothetical protein
VDDSKQLGAFLSEYWIINRTAYRFGVILLLFSAASASSCSSL